MRLICNFMRTVDICRSPSKVARNSPTILKFQLTCESKQICLSSRVPSSFNGPLYLMIKGCNLIRITNCTRRCLWLNSLLVVEKVMIAQSYWLFLAYCKCQSKAWPSLASNPSPVWLAKLKTNERSNLLCVFYLLALSVPSFAFKRYLPNTPLYPAVKIKTPNLTIITKLREFLSDYYPRRVFIGFLSTNFFFVELFWVIIVLLSCCVQFLGLDIKILLLRVQLQVFLSAFYRFLVVFCIFGSQFPQLLKVGEYI
jgi:hypothetical protein